MRRAKKLRARAERRNAQNEASEQGDADDEEQQILEAWWLKRVGGWEQNELGSTIKWDERNLGGLTPISKKIAKGRDGGAACMVDCATFSWSKNVEFGCGKC